MVTRSDEETIDGIEELVRRLDTWANHFAEFSHSWSVSISQWGTFLVSLDVHRGSSDLTLKKEHRTLFGALKAAVEVIAKDPEFEELANSGSTRK